MLPLRVTFSIEQEQYYFVVTIVVQPYFISSIPTKNVCFDHRFCHVHLRVYYRLIGYWQYSTSEAFSSLVVTTWNLLQMVIAS